MGIRITVVTALQERSLNAFRPIPKPTVRLCKCFVCDQPLPGWLAISAATLVTLTGFEPVFFCVRGKRDIRYSTGPYGRKRAENTPFL